MFDDRIAGSRSVSSMEDTTEKDDRQREQARVSTECRPDDRTEDQADVGQQNDRGLPRNHSHHQAAE
jgi:hypothetical protein